MFRLSNNSSNEPYLEIIFKDHRRIYAKYVVKYDAIWI
jgi:hypothetical protein